MYKTIKKEITLMITIGKTIIFEGLYAKLHDKNGDKKLHRLLKARERGELGPDELC